MNEQQESSYGEQVKALGKARLATQREAGLYAAAHPEETFASIAKKYGMSEQWVSEAARSVGLAPRKPGRKPKKETIQL